ncbi:hypothetical protein ACGFJC_47120 [Nonomuraea fuscirosea]|uniref:hypothetical protein n=1 Tax=Nonomuraea fuscirosea TaxID=1291556 RepID=UPI003717307C
MEDNDDEAAARRRPGRPTKLTPELAAQLCGYVRAGNYLTVAADKVGVHEATVYRWLERGEEVDQRDDDTDVSEEDAAAADFYRAFREARADAEIMFVGVLLEDAQGGVVVKETTRSADGSVEETTRTPPNYKAALEWLSRTKNDRWGSRKALEVSGPDGGPVTLDHQSGVVEHLAERVAAVKAKLEADQAQTAPGGGNE